MYSSHMFLCVARTKILPDQLKQKRTNNLFSIYEKPMHSEHLFRYFRRQFPSVKYRQHDCAGNPAGRMPYGLSLMLDLDK
jgi:hypothetical protein